MITARIITAANLKNNSVIVSRTAPPPKVGLRQFMADVKDKKIYEAHFDKTNSTVKYLGVDGNYGQVNVYPNDKFWNTMAENDVNLYIDDIPMQIDVLGNIGSIFWLLLVFSIFRNIFTGNRGNGVNPFMNRTDLKAEENITTRFTDVEGIDSAKEELEEIVDFLKNPTKYEGSGAKIPKGALLSGPPGSGKTLIARAIAGESSVPFIQCSASSFVEVFVGVGAKRVRDLFAFARTKQPCIIFIDEIDAIGRARSNNGPFGGNEEREQTINQLLTEMDGFDDTSKIVVIAATNREDILDEALVRPGRFDRKIAVGLPSVKGREKILGVHTRDKILDADVSLENIARQTTGFSGAELANLMNECAIYAARFNGGVITSAVVEECFQRVVVGSINRDATMSLKKKELIAYHEAGHAVVGALMKDYDRVRKVSIISRGNTGGVTFFQPLDENQDSGLYTKDYLLSSIMVALGGAVAEEIIYGENRVTTGASNDLAKVFGVARDMVMTYGFGDSIGKQNVDQEYLSGESLSYADDEIRFIIDSCYDETKRLITENMDVLEKVKDELLEKDIIEGQFVYDLLD